MKWWRILLIFLLIVVFCGATFLKLLGNAWDEDEFVWDRPQFSVADSKWKGVYICPAKAEPSTFQWKGMTISFREIWLERQVQTEHVFIWFNRLHMSRSEYLCFTLSTSNPEFKDPNFAYFRCNFGNHGGATVDRVRKGDDQLFRVLLDENPSLDGYPSTITMSLTKLGLVKDGPDLHPFPIKVTW